MIYGKYEACLTNSTPKNPNKHNSGCLKFPVRYTPCCALQEFLWSCLSRILDVSPPLCEAIPITSPPSLLLCMWDLFSISSHETKYTSNFPAGPQGNHPKSHPVYYKRSLKQLLVPQRERRASCSTCPKDLPLAATGSRKHKPNLPPHPTVSIFMSPIWEIKDLSS